MSKDLLVNLKHLLCPPGNGVHTVNTAKERKQTLHHKLYPNADDVEKSWMTSVESQFQKHQDGQRYLLGIASDCGAGIVRGSNWGPLFLRDKLYSTKHSPFFDLGDIRVVPHLLHDKYLNDETINICREKLYGCSSVNLPVSPLSMTEHFLDEFYEKFPRAEVFALGGDHSVSYPLVKSYLKKQKKLGINTALIHFDAHTDLLDIRLGIDLCFGTWTYHILDDLQSSDHIVQLGIRSSGKDRDHWEKKFNIKQYWSHEITDANLDDFSQSIVDHLKKINVEEIYISFDIDGIDAKYASATGTPEINGLYPHHATVIINYLKNNFKITGGDMVEVAPFVSYPDIIPAAPEPENTVSTAVSLLNNMMERE